MSIRDELARIINMPSEWPWGTKPRMKAIIDAILARYAVVELPEPEWDDDGQAWLDDIRVDLTGSKIHHRAYVGKAHTPSTAAGMRNDASRLLAAAKLLEDAAA